MMTAAKRIAEILVQDENPKATIPTAYGRKTREGIAALIEDQMTDNLRRIDREEFENSGFRMIELARGEVVFPDGRNARFNARICAKPGRNGDVFIVSEDINTERETKRALRRGWKQ